MPGRLSIGVSAIILLLVPGLVALVLYFRISNRRDELTRIQWLTFSIAISLISLFLLYISTPIHFDWITTLIDETVGEPLVADKELLELSFPVLISFYIFHVIITMIIGAGSGWFDNRFWSADQVLDRRAPWKYAFDEAEDEEVEVTLEDGTVIRGQFNEAAWTKDDRELYLEAPSIIEYEDGEDGREEELIEIGRSVLLKESSMAYVVFTESDPETEFEPSEDAIELSKEIVDRALQETGFQSDILEYGELDKPSDEDREDEG